MTTLDDFFSKPTDSLHPRLRNWKTRLGQPGTSATLEIYRPETNVYQSQPEMKPPIHQGRESAAAGNGALG